MKRFGLDPRKGESTAFPFEPAKIREAALGKDNERVAREMLLGKEWAFEVNSGVCRTWEDLKFIRDNWDGPIVLKGIQRVSVSVVQGGSSLIRQSVIPLLRAWRAGRREGDRTGNRRNHRFEPRFVACVSVTT